MGLFQFYVEQVGSYLNMSGFTSNCFPSLGVVSSAEAGDEFLYVSGTTANTMGRLDKNLVWTPIAYPVGATNTSGRLAYDKVKKRLHLVCTVASVSTPFYSNDNGNSWVQSVGGTGAPATTASIAANDGIVIIGRGNNVITSVDGGLNYLGAVTLPYATLSNSRVVWQESIKGFTLCGLSTLISAEQGGYMYSPDGILWSFQRIGSIVGSTAPANAGFVVKLGDEFVGGLFSGMIDTDKGALAINRNLSSAGQFADSSVLLPSSGFSGGSAGVCAPYPAIYNNVLFFVYGNSANAVSIAAYTKGGGVKKVLVNSAGITAAINSVRLVVFNKRLLCVSAANVASMLLPPFYQY